MNKQIFKKIISKLKSKSEYNNELEIDNQLVEKINKFALIKHILKNKSGNEQEIIELLDDISQDHNC